MRISGGMGWKAVWWLALWGGFGAWAGGLGCKAATCQEEKDCATGWHCKGGSCVFVHEAGEGERQGEKAAKPEGAKEGKEDAEESGEKTGETAVCESCVEYVTEAKEGGLERPKERGAEVWKDGDLEDGGASKEEGAEGLGEAASEGVAEGRPENVKKGWGEECLHAGECRQNFCAIPIGLTKRICTLNCKTDQDCGSDVCRKTPGVGGFCYPRCKNASDCSRYPGLSLCASEGHCWPIKGVGETCTTNAECQSPLLCKDPGGLGQKICTKICVVEADCAAGFWCEQHDPSQPGYCIPLCQTTTDCRPYTAMPFCNLEKHCWRAFMEDMQQCRIAQECLSYTCAEPAGLGFLLCTRECQTDLDCEISFLCHRQMVGQKGYCVQTCQSADDCKHALSTPVCKNGICWKIE